MILEKLEGVWTEKAFTEVMFHQGPRLSPLSGLGPIFSTEQMVPDRLLVLVDFRPDFSSTATQNRSSRNWRYTSFQIWCLSVLKLSFLYFKISFKIIAS